MMYKEKIESIKVWDFEKFTEIAKDVYKKRSDVYNPKDLLDMTSSDFKLITERLSIGVGFIDGFDFIERYILYYKHKKIKEILK